jgi:NAD(P)H-hydrate repair Nnr-like enzyme with NAD(P)H-hydrate dehydratase domain
MQEFNSQDLKNLFIPSSDSHKGKNGKLMIIGGSKLFYAASLWSLQIASRIVDMVFYSSVPENNEIVQKAKEEFRNGIVIPRAKIDDYIKEADCILIGPGLPRKDEEEEGDEDTKLLTESLLQRYPEKKWVIDGGSLQTIDPNLIPRNAILTPHVKEFETLFKIKDQRSKKI